MAHPRRRRCDEEGVHPCPGDRGSAGGHDVPSALPLGTLAGVQRRRRLCGLSPTGRTIWRYRRGQRRSGRGHA
ncbi:MAG: hypothetical protein EOO27_24500 [Comamonadaceae bacterium]|nr:MAG: hypothetical protein EOO27_24500 [Comamonadaceae bacterium]